MEELIQAIDTEAVVDTAEELVEEVAEAAKSGNIVVALAAVGGFAAGVVVTKLVPKAVSFTSKKINDIKEKRANRKAKKSEANETVVEITEETAENTEE